MIVLADPRLQDHAHEALGALHQRSVPCEVVGGQQILEIRRPARVEVWTLRIQAEGEGGRPGGAERDRADEAVLDVHARDAVLPREVQDLRVDLHPPDEDLGSRRAHDGS